MRILLVEDDDLLGDGVFHGLKQYGYTVDWLKDGLSAEHAVKTDQFDAVILDLGLPKRSGLEVLTYMRKNKINTPVLILTAKETVEDRIQGLDSGADDYLVKPFDLDELCARLRAIQRRKSDRSKPVIELDGLVVDPASHQVTYKGQELTLSRREYVLLLKFIESPGTVLSRDYLTQSLYGWDGDVDSNTLEVHVHNLRKKISSDFIKTIRGIGYVAGSPENKKQ